MPQTPGVPGAPCAVAPLCAGHCGQGSSEPEWALECVVLLMLVLPLLLPQPQLVLLPPLQVFNLNLANLNCATMTSA